MLDVFLELAAEAGSIIRQFYEKGDYTTEIKTDNSPVTTADYKANEAIVSGLRSTFPQIPIISEELDVKDKKVDDFFLVDPLDGTKGFIKGTGQFTVNIAYIKEKKPFSGVIYSPMSGDMFFSDEKKNAFRKNRITNSKKILLDRQIKQEASSTARVLISREHLDKKTARFLKSIDEHNTIRMGSSIKFCLLAEGKADFYPRNGPTMEWDTAAGHAILSAAGGSVIDLTTKKELVYGKKNYKNNSFFAYNCSKSQIKSICEHLT